MSERITSESNPGLHKRLLKIVSETPSATSVLLGGKQYTVIKNVHGEIEFLLQDNENLYGSVSVG